MKIWFNLNQESMFHYHIKHMGQSAGNCSRPVNSTCHTLPLEQALLLIGQDRRLRLISLFGSQISGLTDEDPSSLAGLSLGPC